LEAIAEEMQAGDMPPWYYSMMHADARLNPEQRNEIRNWSLSAHKMLYRE
jgi:hypothetical protein